MKNLFKLLIIFCFFAFADDDSQHHDHGSMDMKEHMEHSAKHMSAPIGIMGNMHHKGFMVSIKHGQMQMEGNIFDGDNISDSEILLKPNELSNMPANLSVIPKNMSMSMTMIDAMYAPSENLTLMLMATYLSKDMTLKTYSAMMDRDLLGQFSTSSSDLSDITFSALFLIDKTDVSKWHGEISYLQSIGNNNEMGTVLTPMNTQMEMILPYAMQPSDKATRIILGLTNTRQIGEKTTWGIQAKYKTVANEKDWAFGNQTELNSWLQYQYDSSISFSSRIKFTNQKQISGINSIISAPVQTANTENYGGNELHIGLGLNYSLDIFSQGNEQIGLEVVLPLMQNKNSLQMKTDYQVIVGYQRSF